MNKKIFSKIFTSTLEAVLRKAKTVPFHRGLCRLWKLIGLPLGPAQFGSFCYFLWGHARKRTSTKTIKIKQRKMKQKTHIGNLENYSFRGRSIFKYLGSVPSGSKVTWRYFAITFQLKNKHGVMPSNAGQVLLAFTKANGINTDKFNTCRRVSGRDLVQRIRRS